MLAEGQSAEEPAPFGKSSAPSSSPQGLTGLNPKQLLGTQKVPDAQHIWSHVPLQAAAVMPEKLGVHVLREQVGLLILKSSPWVASLLWFLMLSREMGIAYSFI